MSNIKWEIEVDPEMDMELQTMSALVQCVNRFIEEYPHDDVVEAKDRIVDWFSDRERSG